MTEAERRATEAERIMAEIAPYCAQVEAEAYEAMLIEKDPAAILEAQKFIQASRRFQQALKSAVTLGKSSARVAPAVA